MLPRQHRMVSPEEFRWTLRSGSRGSNRYVVVTIAVPDTGAAIALPENNDPPVTRVGFVVAKREVPRAVDRNRVKRNLRHHCYRVLGELPEGSLVVVRVLGPALRLDGAQLRGKFDDALAKAQEKVRQV